MNFRPGVLIGDEVTELFNYAKVNNFAIPAVNVIGTNSINATLEAAKQVESPVIIQVSNVAAQFLGGSSLPNTNQETSTAGAVSLALHVRQVVHLYGVSVILHTDHANRQVLPWVDSLLKENRIYFERTGESLFSSHMLDLSIEPLMENISTSCAYLKKMREFNLNLEIELGVTGGVEDGLDHLGIDSESLYTKPDEVATAYEHLTAISKNFTIAASFGNVHGVYNPGNIGLKPKILENSQNIIQEKYNTKRNPVNFVFHGGSGCTKEEIHEAIAYGTVKMNINTDLQWAFWSGIRDYYLQNENYLQSQIGSSNGNKEVSNKPYYNPMAWLRKGENSFVKRLIKTFEDLNCVGRNK